MKMLLPLINEASADWFVLIALLLQVISPASGGVESFKQILSLYLVLKGTMLLPIACCTPSLLLLGQSLRELPFGTPKTALDLGSNLISLLFSVLCC